MKRSRESWSDMLLPLSLIVGLVLLLSLNSEQADAEAPSNMLEFWLRQIVGYLAVGAEIAAAIVIAGAIGRAIVSYIQHLLSRGRKHINSTENIRLQLGRVLTLGLEFTLASDILMTAVAPTRQDILDLGSIVLLRTLLNYFLEREIRQGEQNRSLDRGLDDE